MDAGEKIGIEIFIHFMHRYIFISLRPDGLWVGALHDIIVSLNDLKYCLLVRVWLYLFLSCLIVVKRVPAIVIAINLICSTVKLFFTLPAIVGFCCFKLGPVFLRQGFFGQC